MRVFLGFPFPLFILFCVNIFCSKTAAALEGREPTDFCAKGEHALFFFRLSCVSIGPPSCRNAWQWTVLFLFFSNLFLLSAQSGWCDLGSQLMAPLRIGFFSERVEETRRALPFKNHKTLFHLSLKARRHNHPSCFFGLKDSFSKSKWLQVDDSDCEGRENEFCSLLVVYLHLRCAPDGKGKVLCPYRN